MFIFRRLKFYITHPSSIVKTYRYDKMTFYEYDDISYENEKRVKISMKIIIEGDRIKIHKSHYLNIQGTIKDKKIINTTYGYRNDNITRYRDIKHNEYITYITYEDHLTYTHTSYRRMKNNNLKSIDIRTKPKNLQQYYNLYLEYTNNELKTIYHRFEDYDSGLLIDKIYKI